jgi:polar amino acid transport system permease protein
MVKMLGAMLEGSVVSLEIFFLTLLFALPLALPIA